jgi:hypothetical protein
MISRTTKITLRISDQADCNIVAKLSDEPPHQRCFAGADLARNHGNPGIAFDAVFEDVQRPFMALAEKQKGWVRRQRERFLF